jgi:hypothetical protein
MALSTAKRFLREMAQPSDLNEKLGVSLWSVADIARQNGANTVVAMEVDAGEK